MLALQWYGDDLIWLTTAGLSSYQQHTPFDIRGILNFMPDQPDLNFGIKCKRNEELFKIDLVSGSCLINEGHTNYSQCLRIQGARSSWLPYLYEATAGMLADAEQSMSQTALEAVFYALSHNHVDKYVPGNYDMQGMVGLLTTRSSHTGDLLLDHGWSTR